MKDLLELAALAMQAAGVPGFENFTALGDSVCLELGSCRGAITAYWQPHRDDGDCARMEAALGLNVAWYLDGVVVSNRRLQVRAAAYAAHGGDRNAARRMAPLELAAATRKALPC